MVQVWNIVVVIFPRRTTCVQMLSCVLMPVCHACVGVKDTPPVRVSRANARRVRFVSTVANRLHPCVHTEAMCICPPPPLPPPCLAVSARVFAGYDDKMLAEELANDY